MMNAFPHSDHPTPGTWHAHDGVVIVVCPECATENRVLAAHDGSAWVLCANDFCTWRGRVRLLTLRAFGRWLPDDEADDDGVYR